MLDGQIVTEVVPWRDFESDLFSHCHDRLAEIGERLSDWEWKQAYHLFADVLRAGHEPGVMVLLGCALAVIDKRNEDSDE